ncbi:MAG: hypothetical protein AAFN70_18715, partial [Planctomycetota bacterium]
RTSNAAWSFEMIGDMPTATVTELRRDTETHLEKAEQGQRLMTKSTSQTETILPADASALVATADGELEFVLANGPGDMEVQQNVQLLVAVMLRSKDPDWLGEMMAWQEAQDGGE